MTVLRYVATAILVTMVAMFALVWWFGVRREEEQRRRHRAQRDEGR